MNKASNYSCGSELKVNRFLNSIAVICSVAYSSFAISQANWDFNGTDHGWDTSNYSRIKAGEFMQLTQLDDPPIQNSVLRAVSYTHLTLPTNREGER